MNEEFKSAREMLTITKENARFAIFSQISAAANQGYSSVRVSEYMDGELQLFLLNLGYLVECNSWGDWTIDWSDD